MGDKLWNFVNNHVHDIVEELQQPKASRGVNSAHRKHNWVHPPPGRLKLNVDGSHFTNNGSSACGGLIRDHHGKFVSGFMRRITSSNTLATELWATLSGF